MWLQEVLVVFFAHALNVTTWAFQGIAAWIPCSSENMPGFLALYTSV